MSGSRTRPIAIVAGPAEATLQAALDARGWRWIEIGPGIEASALPDPTRVGIVWLPPRIRFDAALAAAIEAWWEQAPDGAPRLATARLCIENASVSVPLGSSVVLASAGAARLSGRGLLALRGAARTGFEAPWRIELPSSIGAHLRAINAESTAEAALSHALGERPSWWQLAGVPLAGSLRGCLGARGARRDALTPAVVESYRAAAAAAKLWELLYAQEPVAT